MNSVTDVYLANFSDFNINLDNELSHLDASKINLADTSLPHFNHMCNFLSVSISYNSNRKS